MKYIRMRLLRATADLESVQLIKRLSATPVLHAQNELDGVGVHNDPQTALQANKATFFFRLVEYTLLRTPPAYGMLIVISGTGAGEGQCVLSPEGGGGMSGGLGVATLLKLIEYS